MGHFHLILLAVALASPLVLGKPNSYESTEDFSVGLNDFLSAEGSFEDGLSSEEIPLAGMDMSYYPAKDGPADAHLDKIIKSLPPGSYIPNESGIRKEWRQMYQDYLGQPLPEVTPQDMKKMDMRLNQVELKRHNELRAEHDAEPLVFDRKLAAFAQNYAEKIANKMSQGYPFQHNPDTKKYRIGENKAGDYKQDYSGDGTNRWYAEIKAYHANGNRPACNGCKPHTGHFTQVVWKGSKKMGCGRSPAKTRQGTEYVTICNYYPAGNMQGQENFDKNVVA